jgi:hypothetical protein
LFQEQEIEEKKIVEQLREQKQLETKRRLEESIQKKQKQTEAYLTAKANELARTMEEAKKVKF